MADLRIDHDTDVLEIIERINQAIARYGVQFKEDGLEHDGFCLYDLVRYTVADHPRVPEAIKIAGQVTKEIFGIECSCQRVADPEIFSTDRLVFTVKCSGDLQEIIAKQTRWHEELAKRLRNFPAEFKTLFCLSPDVN